MRSALGGTRLVVLFRRFVDNDVPEIELCIVGRLIGRFLRRVFGNFNIVLAYGSIGFLLRVGVLRKEFRRILKSHTRHNIFKYVVNVDGIHHAFLYFVAHEAQHDTHIDAVENDENNACNFQPDEEGLKARRQHEYHGYRIEKDKRKGTFSELKFKDQLLQCDVSDYGNTKNENYNPILHKLFSPFDGFFKTESVFKDFNGQAFEQKSFELRVLPFV